MLQTIRAENVDDQNEVICLVFMFSSCVMVLKLSKIVHLLQFCADLSKKPKPIKAITYMHLKILITQVLRQIPLLQKATTGIRKELS